MRLLVFSDSHGSIGKMLRACELHPEADVLVHLGDCERDFNSIKEALPGKTLVQVCGNCDYSPQFPERELIRAGDKLVYCTHGHAERVKYGLDTLRNKAIYCGAAVALYGHTHLQRCDYIDGIYYFNPGSVRDGKYGMVDVTDTGIMCIEADIE